jgi:transcriptional regulator
MHEILKLHLQGLSAYKIARRLNLDPPTVYVSLKAAKQNFQEADKMLEELKAMGWPMKVLEVEEALQKRRAQETTPKMEEIAFKMG